MLNVDFSTKYPDYIIIGRINKTRQTKDHDDLYNRCSFKRRRWKINTIQN